ncbi:hypothetical protein BFP78_11455 [Gaetbulibacter sp. 5U11]|nr:hypothetical protein BFP78_11455 [Gaetbulibacter sp. 5U11]
MKNKLLAYFTILGLFFILSCSNEGSEDLKREFQYFYEIENVAIQNELNNKISNGTESIVKTTISSSKPLDLNSDFDTFVKYISLAKPDIKINILLDDVSVVLINIENGVMKQDYPNSGLCPECDHDSNGNISDSTECSQQGIKQCAFSTYQQWSTAQIIWESLTGGAQQVVLSCGTRNCFGWA